MGNNNLITWALSNRYVYNRFKMDIRNFFNAKTKSQPTNKIEVVKNRPKPLISDSSDEDVINGSPQKNYNSKKNLFKRDDNQNKKAAKRRLSNSSSDEFEENSNTKVNNGKSRKIESKTLQSSKQGSSGNGASKTDSSNKNEKLKPVEVEDFFGSSKTKVKEKRQQKQLKSMTTLNLRPCFLVWKIKRKIIN